MITRREWDTPVWRQLLKDGAAELRKAGVPDPDTDAWLLLEAASGMDRAHYYMEAERPVHPSVLEKFLPRYEAWLTLRAKRIPLQRILGTVTFMGLPFAVRDQVLIPRQDTETLVELVLDRERDRAERILDLCTGSGCIGVSLAVLGGYADVTLGDISREAVKAAAANAMALWPAADGERCHRKTGEAGVVRRRTVLSSDPLRIELTASEGGKMTVAESDLFAALEPEGWDVITANPPYIATGELERLEPEVRDYEPRLALDGEADGLRFYRRLALEAPAYLRRGGHIYLEIGYDQGAAVRDLLCRSGFSRVVIHQDLAGLDRVVTGEYS